MCHPKPGPRCSAHARARLDRASDDVREATAAHDQARAVLESATDANRAEAQAAYIAARDAVETAKAAKTAALQEFETTPDGQRHLMEAAARENDQAVRAAIQRRLDEAQQTRAAQLDDLRAATEAHERLMTCSGDDAAALAADEARVRAAQDQLDAATADHQAAEAAWRPINEELLTTDRQVRELQIAEHDAAEKTREAAKVVAERARQLYIESGVQPRFAGFYANDMVNPSYRASELSGTPRVPTGRLRMKVKRNGDDAARTNAAALLANNDEQFIAANDRLAEAAKAHAAAQKRTQEFYRSGLGPRAQDESDARRRMFDAKHRMEDASKAVATARAAQIQRRARIGSGVPAAAEKFSMRDLTDQIVRQPDGSTNAWIYQLPSDGLPDGRFVPVTGVDGDGLANNLVLSNGKTVSAGAHYYRSVDGARTDSRNPVVLVAPPAAESVPLRSEGLATAGFFSYIDSTD